MPQEEVPVCVVRSEEGVFNRVLTERKNKYACEFREESDSRNGRTTLRKERRGLGFRDEGGLQVTSPVPMALFIRTSK